MRTARVKIGRMRFYMRMTFRLGWRTQRSQHHHGISVTAMPAQILQEQGIAPPEEPRRQRVKSRSLYLGPLEIRWEARP